ncbi:MULTISPECIES: SDR family oxidoreductase [Bacteria]|jgi:NAD(P)-dependent dehydrogenase (short-subunit alcohol dehydrogenase family)|uniref:Short chain dehydrogenase n=14 Tax=Bacteria TaxID=2 RepID=A8VYA6_LATSK|nr:MULTISPECIES: SDR family oxidoreductase [Bacteria]EKJ3887914.1 SDR family oxidoreductase [Salmonella enterica subsp. enterica serovar Give]POC05321.1 short-chain dehydrogenase/reductase [Vibrio vulnificus]GEO59658.1 short-chain dehydrogenase/reductase [Companilactobacillus paralimentarius]HBM4320230.1 SDR family oxidoreductase [Listeria innocua]ABW71678.1 short chain dehydrogenase [Latilactobacillus sakei]
MTFSNVENTRVWFITGASSGLGYEFTKKVLESGDKVVGVARNIEKLNELKYQFEGMLLPLSLDVTDRSAVFTTVETAIKHFGRIDIVINNAGNMVLGMIEEFSEDEVRSQMETNFYGAIWICQAAMPYLRTQGSGHIIQISSIGGLITGPMSGIYSASKFALEGFSEALAQEAAHFGVKVSIVEPGGYWTNLYLKMSFTTQNKEYDSLREKLAQQNSTESVDSDPKLAAEAIMKLVNSENPPLRLILGSLVYDLAVENAEKRISTWKEWESVSRSAEHGIPAPEGYGIIEE